ncbi:hypothetical protein [Falsirhodobacter xinxiangensis]|uniref:hypothetical protein n=1 Tax=Falsirhodobacter xinxiangensis TaxID=2530049 RepID=UPI0010AB1FBA|nr:hypothetical protein [Rhodobacter xinxiangensis]
MRITRSISAALFPVVAAFAAFTAPTEAKAYDIDCKLILCMAGGFPATCGDAYDHMIDRLRDGKSPVGTCTMSDGEEYSNYNIDYSFANRTSSDAWICPEGKNKHFSRNVDGDNRTEVKVFCYDERRRIGYGGGFNSDSSYYYTGVSTPEYKNFRVQITVEPGTEAEYTNGVQRYRTDHGYGFGSTRVSFRP